jgi:AcrR family transcriptional regulator
MPKLSKTQEAARRDRLLDAAERCFARSGFNAATMQEIAREARVSAGAVYLYFASKDALVAGIAERDRRLIAKDFGALVDAPDFFAALEALARHYVIERPPHKRVLHVEIAAEATRNREVARSYRAVDRLVRERFRRSLEKRRRAGEIAPTLDTERLATLLMLLGDGMFLRRATDPDFDVDRILAAVIDMVRSLLNGNSAPRRMARRSRRTS